MAQTTTLLNSQVLIPTPSDVENDQSMSIGKKENNKKRRGKSLKVKKTKPMMERRRRERINECLEQLKQILVQDMHKNSYAHPKWEKADILEMTVDYLRQLRKNREGEKSGDDGAHQDVTNSSPQPILPGGVAPNASLIHPMFQNYLAAAYQQQLAAFPFVARFPWVHK